jgi:cytochrome c556
MKQVVLAIGIMAIGTAGLFGAATQARAVEVEPSAVLAIRQAGFDLQGANLGDIKRAVEAKVTEVKPFKPNAEAILAWSKVIPTLFPAGTDDRAGTTKALPAVWSDRGGFERAAAKLSNASESLVKAADDNDPAAFAVAFKATADACGGCHRPFRAK